VEEQWQEREIELFLGFWRSHGRSIAIGIVAALVIVAGYRVWRYESRARGERMSAAYTRLERDLGHHHFGVARTEAELILHRYAGSAYAVFAALTLAKLDAMDSDWTEAQALLRREVDEHADPALRPLIRIRLARILLDQNQPQAVLELFHGHNPGAYAGVTAWLRGRAERRLGHPLKAHDDFTLALDNLPPGSGLGRIVKLEMATLAVMQPVKPKLAHKAPTKPTGDHS
jgi:predicted negative regulator of RcsB-dependent stress response